MIRLVIDSTCEVPPALENHPSITVLPLSVVFGQTALRDGLEITREQFWERLPKSNPLPTTSQATPSDFEGPFQKLTDAGDEVIAITLSSKLSGTYEAALTAQAGLPGRPIDVVDSRSISIGSGLMVQKAVAMIAAGCGRQAITSRMLQMREDIHLLFALDTLEYLQRGGRIGRAQALVGTLLRFKPLLGLQDGEVYPATRVRTRRRALETMVEMLGQKVPQRGPSVSLGVAQAAAPEEAAQVAKSLCALFQTQRIYISTLGPVIGTHVGPGVVAAVACHDGD